MLVLDANILIRAVLGSRVLGMLRKYAGQVEFMAPDVAFQETQEHLPGILEARKIAVAPAMATLDLLVGLVQTVDAETYSSFEAIAPSASPDATRTIGRCWPPRSHSAARSGPKTSISSAAEWPLGPRIEWSCTWRRPRSERYDGRDIRSAHA